MALADLSFKLYSDAALTTLFGSTLSVTHQSDLSDNPQDFEVYFGSPATAMKLEATSNPGLANITLTPTDILPLWEASTAQTLGYSAEPTVQNDRRYVVTTAGTSGASEPTWPVGIGSTVLDGSITWTCVSRTHEPTELKLATTLAGLDSATAGAALILGTSVLSGTDGAIPLHIRITNTVTTPSSNTATPELSININNVTETAV